MCLNKRPHCKGGERSDFGELRNFVILFSWDVTVDELHKYYTDVCVKGYDVVRHDRKRSGGGICIYIRKSIRFVKRTDLVPENLEVACIEVTKPNGRPFILFISRPLQL